MKNKRMLMLLMALGLVGCKSPNMENENTADKANDMAKLDTALVLHHRNQSYSWGSENLLYVKGADKVCTDFSIMKKSTVISDWSHTLKDVANVGDTVLVAFHNGTPHIVRNLTMENKIKAFSTKQK